MLAQLVSWDFFSFQVHFFSFFLSLTFYSSLFVLVNLPFQFSLDQISVQCVQVATLKWPAMLLENTEIYRTPYTSSWFPVAPNPPAIWDLKGGADHLRLIRLGASNSYLIRSPSKSRRVIFQESNKDSRWNSRALYFSFRFLNLRSHVNVCLSILRSFFLQIHLTDSSNGPMLFFSFSPFDKRNRSICR